MAKTITKWRPVALRGIGKPRIRWEVEVRRNLGKMKIRYWDKMGMKREAWKRIFERARTHKQRQRKKKNR